MNAVNADDADNEEDDDDAELDPVCPKVSDVWEAMHDCMPFSFSGTDIQQKLNALSFQMTEIKITQSDIRTFFNEIYNIFYSTLRIEKKRKLLVTLELCSSNPPATRFIFLVPWRFKLSGVYCNIFSFCVKDTEY